VKNKIDKTLISGVESTNVPAVYGSVLGQARPAIFVVSSFGVGEKIKKGLDFFCPERNVFLVAEEDPFFLQYETKSLDGLLAKVEILKAMLEEKDSTDIYIMPISAFVRRLMPVSDFISKKIHLNIGDEIEIGKILQKLTKNGYSRFPVVDCPGQLALRGDILDIFPFGEENPVRLDFFDITLESIKRFDLMSQRSVGEKLETLTIFPFGEGLIDGTGHFYENPSTVLDYLAHNAIAIGKTASFDIVTVEEDSLASRLELAYGEAVDDYEKLLLEGRIDADSFSHYPEEKSVKAFITRHTSGFAKNKIDFDIGYINFSQFGIDPLREKVKYYDRVVNIETKQPIKLNGSLELLSSELRRYKKQKMSVSIVFSSQEKLNSLREFLLENKLEENVSLQTGELLQGVELVKEKRVFLWEGDIFKHIKKKRSRFKSENSEQIHSQMDIQPGDFVVHESHGIGKFAGIVSLTVNGNTNDFLKIVYKGEDLLYVPMDQIHHIGKYIGGKANPPRINSLTTDSWKQTKRRASERAMEIASNLIEFGAKRQASKGYAFSPDTVWQQDFEEDFAYEETEDQLRAIEAIKNDMEKPLPMDRLLCGDVGYGKTEVALRAIFKCIADGKQAAVLVPTTVLAGQHEQTFKARFADFPFSVSALSRFKSEKEQKKILKNTERGQLDVVIGTHRLLSKDVKFKDLGLLVIDEEHKFGVSHKEKIKDMRANVDVLTLTATPIPRTLNMSLVGIRDMDLIETPPEERYPVQTYVCPKDEEIIREIIVRELDRDGQVFIVVPRINRIGGIVDIITKILPNVTFAIAHGQLGPNTLEDIMLDFTMGKYDILISTSIIESGLDIPRANTIIVIDADHFGLSQLYQMRGRVGRTNRMAFAYFMHQPGKELSEVAQARLRAIKEFAQLGAGFKLAMRDLEIRGAGNILGAEQSGHIDQVGYELYVRLIEEAILELKGEGQEKREEIDVVLKLNESAFIPKTYIDNEELRLDMYRQISNITDLTDVDELSTEFSDRFSGPPREVVSLLFASYISKQAGKLGIEEVRRNDEKVDIIYKMGRFSPESISRIPEKHQLFLEVNAGKKVHIAIEKELSIEEVAQVLAVM
jgi:transcription-repair coupling factor (superfamily II helicase)